MKTWRRKGALAILAASTTMLAVAAAFVVLPSSTPSVEPPENLPAVSRDLESIIQDGVLRVAASRDDLAYTSHRGRTEGMSYDMALAFSQRLGLELEIVEPRNPARALRDLAEGRVDLAAFADPGPVPVLTPTAWSSAFEISHPVLVGRLAHGITSVQDLAGQTIAVRRHSALGLRVRAWQRELGGRLDIVWVGPETTDQQLALRAARRVYPLVVMDQRRAYLEVAAYHALELSAPLGPALPFRWAMRPDSTWLRKEFAAWLDEEIKTGHLAVLEQKYFENPLRLRARRRPAFRARGKILSPYDALFQREADRFGFDWRLLAALAFAESGYDRWEVSSMGAMGLLQLMPAVAREYGAQDPFDPSQNVAAGAALLNWLYDIFDEVPEPDRLKFTLAAYNMGLGHVRDARALAAIRGLHPDRWDDGIAEILPLMSDPGVAATLPHGRARGSVTLRYVNHVTDLFDQFSGVVVPAEHLAGSPAPLAAASTTTNAVSLGP